MEPIARLQLPSRTASDADPRAAELLEGAKHKIGVVPNMYGFMANSPGLFDTYGYGYNLFRQKSGFSPAEQEVVFLSISLENGCEYCMAAHSTLADTASRVPREVTDAIREDRRIPDPKLAALSAFTRTMVQTRGRPSQQDVAEFLAVGYSERQVLEIILAIAVKTLSNYTNHLFETPVDPAFAARIWHRDDVEARAVGDRRGQSL